MDTRFLPHNTHLEKPEVFIKQDSHLKQLNKQALVHRSQLLDQIPRYISGIYTLSRGRQTGKTTLLKQWMAELLESRVPPDSIAYMTGELVDDHHSLIRLVTDLLTEMPDKDLKVIFLDEVTYIRDWDKGVKYLADAGMLENTVLVITGSDMVIIKEARIRFPGRRGISEKVDFHLYPLSFFEYVKLSKRKSHDEINLLTITSELPRLDKNSVFRDRFLQYLLIIRSCLTYFSCTQSIVTFIPQSLSDFMSQHLIQIEPTDIRHLLPLPQCGQVKHARRATLP